MFGDVNSNDNMGIVSRSCRDVFAYMKEAKEKDGITCTLKVAMIEIYNEQINDLLGSGKVRGFFYFFQFLIFFYFFYFLNLINFYFFISFF